MAKKLSDYAGYVNAKAKVIEVEGARDEALTELDKLQKQFADRKLGRVLPHELGKGGARVLSLEELGAKISTLKEEARGLNGRLEVYKQRLEGERASASAAICNSLRGDVRQLAATVVDSILATVEAEAALHSFTASLEADGVILPTTWPGATSGKPLNHPSLMPMKLPAPDWQNRIAFPSERWTPTEAAAAENTQVSRAVLAAVEAGYADTSALQRLAKLCGGDCPQWLIDAISEYTGKSRRAKLTQDADAELVSA